MKVVFVHNPKSGSALGTSDLRKKCQKAGITIEKFIAIDDHLSHKLAPYTKKPTIIAAIGGDGTISAIAGIVANTKATLLPIPGGTLNHFTKDLGIPQDIDTALIRAAKLKPRHIDIARVNDTYFTNNSSIGMYPAALQERKQFEPRIGKWTAAVVASFRAFVRLKTYQVTIDSQTFTTPFIFVGNNRYTLDESIGTTRTSLEKGVLTVFVAKTQSRLTLLKIALFALASKAADLPEFDIFYPQHLTVKTKKSLLSVSHDGEVSRLTVPLNYTIEPSALKIIG